MAYLADVKLASIDLMDECTKVAWELADWLRQRVSPDAAKDAALKTMSEFVYRSVSQGMADAESMARQLEGMARYCREHLK
jgi:hypothetical protein